LWDRSRRHHSSPLDGEVQAIDLTPRLLERARENSRIAGVEVSWREGDAEDLRSALVNSMLCLVIRHMFAPRPEVTMAEMLRVLKPGGVIAFATRPEMLVGETSTLGTRYMPPPPPGIVSPILCGDPAVIRKRFGNE
jgi:ubiquinone/menaquinone biosynthesis C-methylase UbiE